MNTFKKVALLIAVAILSFGAVQAKPINFGIKAGLNVNKLHFNKDFKHDFNKSNSCGWTAGVMAEFTVPVIGIGMDAAIMYSRMNNGNDVNYTVADPGSVAQEESVNLYGKNFIDIPINIKYKFTIPVIASVLKPYVFTGPDFAFRMDKNVTDAYAKLKSRTFQMAWNVGLGLEFINHLQIGASYGFGCNKIVETLHIDEATHVNMDDNVKNNYWTVSVAYLF